jgi:hypothetical protein
MVGRYSWAEPARELRKEGTRERARHEGERLAWNWMERRLRPRRLARRVLRVCRVAWLAPFFLLRSPTFLSNLSGIHACNLNRLEQSSGLLQVVFRASRSLQFHKIPHNFFPTTESHDA